MDNDLKKTHKIYFLPGCWLLFLSMMVNLCYAVPSDGDLSVWANEAIVNTYTFSANNFLNRQKEIAKYFTTQAWVNYNKALQASKLNEAIQKNNYTVSSVALLPPTLKNIGKEWQATMPLLVLYANAHYQQKQTLAVVITFTTAQANEGVRGLVLTSFTTTVTAPPCRCEGSRGTNTIV